MEEREKAPTIKIENARIIWRNFAGKEGPFNKEGERGFDLVLDEDTAMMLAKDDWNVKFKEPKDEGDPGMYHLPVKVEYSNYPPKIVMVTSTARTRLDESSVEVLDWSDIANIDLIIRGYSWAVNGKSGVKAYVKTMYVTIDEDELDLKYNSMPLGGD